MPGGEGFLTTTVRMRVRPEPECEEELVDLLKTETRSTTQSRRLLRRGPHRFLGPTRFSTESSRRLSIAKSWLSNPNKGTMPKAKTLRLWLTPKLSYRIKGNYVEVLGGYRLRIVGWDRRYDQYPSGEARLMYKEGKFFLMIFKRVPRPSKYTPKGVLAVDVNEKEIFFGNGVVRALRYKRLAERLQEYNAWLRGILKRLRHFHRKARNIIEDWAKKSLSTRPFVQTAVLD